MLCDAINLMRFSLSHTILFLVRLLFRHHQSHLFFLFFSGFGILFLCAISQIVWRTSGRQNRRYIVVSLCTLPLAISVFWGDVVSSNKCIAIIAILVVDTSTHHRRSILLRLLDNLYTQIHELGHAAYRRRSSQQAT